MRADGVIGKDVDLQVVTGNGWDEALDAPDWPEEEMLAQLKTDGVVGDDVVLQVATGNGWDEALETAEWKDGDLLALGTTSRRS